MLNEPLFIPKSGETKHRFASEHAPTETVKTNFPALKLGFPDVFVRKIDHSTKITNASELKIARMIVCCNTGSKTSRVTFSTYQGKTPQNYGKKYMVRLEIV